MPIASTTKFRYVQNYSEDQKEATFLLYDVIGSFVNDNGDVEQGIDGRIFANEILALQNSGISQINVRINSEGGNVLDGYSICSAILNSNIPVHTYCDGLAASIAGVILMCGHEKHIMDYGTIMLHNPSGATPELLELIKNTLVRILKNNTPLDAQSISDIMDATTFYTADQAKTLGLVDEIINSGKKIKIDSSDLAELATIYNQLIIPTTKNIMETENTLGIESPTTLTNIEPITNDSKQENQPTYMKHKLGLAENATNEEVSSALDKLLNEHKTFKDSLTAIENEKTAQKENSIAEMLNNAESLGKIKNEEIEGYKILARANFEATKNLLEKIGTKTSVKIFNQKDHLIKNVDEDKSQWTYWDWCKKDPKGFEDLKNSSPDTFKLIQQKAFPNTKIK